MLFDDGFVKVLKGHRISKSSPLFDPIKSSKQDRREKKRKINVAQLFKKKPRTTNSEEKPRITHSEEKPKKSPDIDSSTTNNISQNMDDSQISNVSQDEPDELVELSQEDKSHSWKIQYVQIYIM